MNILNKNVIFSYFRLIILPKKKKKDIKIGVSFLSVISELISANQIEILHFLSNRIMTQESKIGCKK